MLQPRHGAAFRLPSTSPGAALAGGKALIVLSDILNKAIPEYCIPVLPYPGADGTVKGFATGEISASGLVGAIAFGVGSAWTNLIWD